MGQAREFGYGLGMTQALRVRGGQGYQLDSYMVDYLMFHVF